MKLVIRVVISGARHRLYFVIVGITLPDKDRDVLAAFIEKEYAENKVNTEKEFKAITWVKNSKKRKSLQRIVAKIGCLHSGMAVVIVEKRFMEACLILDSFFDGAYNDIEDYSSCNNKELMRETANYYYDRLTDDELSLIAKTIIKGGDLKDYQDCLRRIIAVTNNDRFLSMLNGSKSHLEEIRESNENIASSDDGVRQRVLRSPNYTAFYAVCNILAKQCVMSDTTTAIVFDSASMCNREFESLYNHFSSLKNVGQGI